MKKDSPARKPPAGRCNYLDLERLKPQSDPVGTLKAVTQVRRYMDALERQALEAGRSDGATLQELADALGISRQAVHRKVRKL